MISIAQQFEEHLTPEIVEKYQALKEISSEAFEGFSYHVYEAKQKENEELYYLRALNLQPVSDSAAAESHQDRAASLFIQETIKICCLQLKDIIIDSYERSNQYHSYSGLNKNALKDWTDVISSFEVNRKKGKLCYAIKCSDKTDAASNKEMGETLRKIKEDEIRKQKEKEENEIRKQKEEEEKKQQQIEEEAGKKNIEAGFLSQKQIEELLERIPKLDEYVNDTEVKELELYSKEIKDEGAMLIGMNTSWQNLVTLDLKNNNIGSIGAIALSKNTSWSSLAYIYLSEN